MKILLTNDDGVEAKGIWALHEALTKAGHTVWIVAPRYEQSAKSHAITTRDPIRPELHQPGVYSVTGTPADSVIIAFEHLVKDEGIDLVVSGINAGQNLGDDIFYSGTVAAAIEAACYGKPAIAISITSYKNQHYHTASKVLIKLLDAGIMQFATYREPLNINVPNIPFEDITGYTVCQAGYRRYQNILHRAKDHRGGELFWLGGDNPLIDKSDYEVDGYVVKENKVAITPLKIDLNYYQKIKQMSAHLAEAMEN